MLVATFCALLSVIGTYFIAQARMDQSINAARLGQLAEVNPELSRYLETQEGYSGHFDNIAQIIQKEDRKQLLSSLPLVFGSVFVVSSLLGWLLAQRLLEPVNEAYAIQRRFMQDAAHELRNPLAAMKSILQQTRAQKLTSSQLDTNLASLERQTDHLTNITTDLLLLERTEVRPTKQIDIVPLLHDVTEELHFKSQNKRVKVMVDAPDKLQVAIAPSHFVAITKNLIDNAIKFSPAQKQAVVRVTLIKNSAGWKLIVRDTGMGIKKAEQKHLTQRFYRATNSSQVDGTGLGLAIVAKYVALYDGDLQITSVPQKGTTVTVTA